MVRRYLLLWNFSWLSACMRISNKAMEEVLFLISKFLPKGHCVPNTMDKLQRVVCDLGLDYIKIDACENHCVLFREEYEKLDI
jgi:hypothetical protein